MTTYTIKELCEIGGEIAPGPKPKFTIIDLIKFLFILQVRSPVGRKALSKRLGLGEGTIRTMLSRMQNNKIIEVGKDGCKLTEIGKRYSKAISKLMLYPKPIKASDLTQSRYSYFILLRKVLPKVKTGIEQRDAVVRLGGKGAFTIICSGKKFKSPSEDMFFEDKYPSSLWMFIRNTMSPKDGDVIIITGADSQVIAENGAIAAALTLLEPNIVI